MGLGKQRVNHKAVMRQVITKRKKAFMFIVRRAKLAAIFATGWVHVNMIRSSVGFNPADKAIAMRDAVMHAVQAAREVKAI